MLVLLLFTFILLVILWLYLQPPSRMRLLAEQIPGPQTYPIIGNLLDIPSDPADAIPLRKEYIKRYGHVIRMWVANNLLILLSDPKDVEVILNSTVHIEKSVQYDYFHPWLGTGLLTSGGEKWHSRRKAITPTFHFKILEQFVDVFNKNGEMLIKCLDDNIDKPAFDIQPYICRYALDVICESAMGTEVNAQSNPKSKYVEAVRTICNVIFSRARKPWLRNNLMFALFGGLSSQTKALKILQGFTYKVIEEKKKILASENISDIKNSNERDTVLGGKRKIAFLELLLKMMNSSSKVFVNDNDIREEVDTFMFEGHDTTTSAICFIACLLAKHPNVQDKIIDEINQLGIKPSEITYQNLMEAKYLERVIKESLRLYPSVPFVARHIKQDVKVHTGDYVLPAGSTVILSSYFIHRHSDYYKNPEEFNPDNFLADEVAKSHAYAFIPFSAGPRNCIGQKFAMLELKATIIKLVSRYVIEYAGEEWDVVPKPIFILQSSNGFHIKIKKRHQEAIKC